MSYLSVSQMNEWLACQHRWKLGYRHNLKPIVTRPYIVLGSIVHQGLEAGFNELWRRPGDLDNAEIYGNMAIEEAIQQQNLTMEDDEWHVIFERANIIMMRGLTTWDISEEGQYEVATFEGKPATELHLEVPLPGWDGFQCYIDLVLRDKRTGALWLVDHKVRQTFFPEDSEDTNLQMAVYQYILTFNDLPVVGTMTHQISSKEETPPVMTTKGAMSRAVVKCTWETYRKCLVEEGLNPDDYVEMASKLKGEFVRVYETYRTTVEVTNIWKSIVLPVAQDVHDAKVALGDPILPRVFNHRECNGCLFRSLCLGALRGDDVDFIARTNFEMKKGRWKPREDPTRQGVQ